MIPKILHQTWKSKTIPPEWQAYTQKNCELHPDWEYRLWTDEDNTTFVREEYPDFFDLFTSYPKGVMRADVIRYLIMYRIGGVYMDLDYEFLKPFDLINHPLVLPQNASVEREGFFRIGNCVFGSTPGHHFWEAVFKDLADHGVPDSAQFDVEEFTGPGMMTRVALGLDPHEFHVYENPAGKHDDVDPHYSILEQSSYAFHPGTPKTSRQRQRILNDGSAYGIHHCAGTWRPRVSTSARILRRVRKLIWGARR